MNVIDYCKKLPSHSHAYCLAYLLCLLVFFLLKDNFGICMSLFVMGIECFVVLGTVRLVVNVLRRRYMLAVTWGAWFVIGIMWMVMFCVNARTGVESAVDSITREMSISPDNVKELWHHGGMDSAYVFIYEGTWSGAGFEEITLQEEKSRIVSSLRKFKKHEALIEIKQDAPLFYKYTHTSTSIIYVSKLKNGWAIFYVGI